MRIKPTFESAAKANDNPNLVFVAVNTSLSRDCGQAFGVNAIPNFIAFSNGSQFKNFKGANEQMLFSTIAELSEKVPKGKVRGAKGHD
jgi:thiol-disulfide isomerase/thioredoxin